MVHVSLRYLSTDFNLTIVSVSKTHCVGVQTFEHSKLKFKNIRMLKFHISLMH